MVSTSTSSSSTTSMVRITTIPPICVSAKPSTDIVFCLLLLWMCKDLGGRCKFDQFAGKEKTRKLGDTCCLLHVVRHDNNRVIILQLCHQFLNLQRCNGIERRCRLIHQQDLGLDCDGTSNTEALLLSTRETLCRSVETIFDFLPECGSTQALFNRFSDVARRFL